MWKVGKKWVFRQTEQTEKPGRKGGGVKYSALRQWSVSKVSLQDTLDERQGKSKDSGRSTDHAHVQMSLHQMGQFARGAS